MCDKHLTAVVFGALCKYWLSEDSVPPHVPSSAYCLRVHSKLYPGYVFLRRINICSHFSHGDVGQKTQPAL